MLFRVIGVSVGVLVCAGLYILKNSRSHQVPSTSEWVQLMRENDLRIAAAKKRNAMKNHSPEAQS